MSILLLFPSALRAKVAVGPFETGYAIFLALCKAGNEYMVRQIHGESWAVDK